MFKLFCCKSNLTCLFICFLHTLVVDRVSFVVMSWDIVICEYNVLIEGVNKVCINECIWVCCCDEASLHLIRALSSSTFVMRTTSVICTMFCISTHCCWVVVCWFSNSFSVFLKIVSIFVNIFESLFILFIARSTPFVNLFIHCMMSLTCSSLMSSSKLNFWVFKTSIFSF